MRVIIKIDLKLRVNISHDLESISFIVVCVAILWYYR